MRLERRVGGAWPDPAEAWSDFGVGQEPEAEAEKTLAGFCQHEGQTVSMGWGRAPLVLCRKSFFILTAFLKRALVARMRDKTTN